MLSALKLAKDEKFTSLNEHLGSVRSILFKSNTNSNFYSIGEDGKILGWDVRDLNRKSEIINNNLKYRTAVISNNGNWLAAAADSKIYLIDLRNPNASARVLEGHTGSVWSLAFAPNDNLLFSTGADKSIIKWDMSTAKGEIVVENNLRIWSLSTRPTSSSYVIGSTEDGKIILWSLSDGAPSTLYEQPGNAIYSVTFNKNGRYLACGDRTGNIKLINPFTGNVIRTLKGHRSRIEDVAFSPNGKYLASSSRDRIVRLWNLENPEDPAIVLTGHNSCVFSVEFSPDSKYLVSSSREDDNILVWPTSIAVMSENMCKHIERNFSQSEWNTYVGDDIPYEKTCN
jgi:WD40 repeat protein